MPFAAQARTWLGIGSPSAGGRIFAEHFFGAAVAEGNTLDQQHQQSPDEAFQHLQHPHFLNEHFAQEQYFSTGFLDPAQE